MPSPYPFEAVLFDMDGVVVDNMPLHRQIWTEFARSLGASPTEAEIRTLDGRRAIDIIAALFGEGQPESEVARLSAAREALYHARLGQEPLREVPGVRAYLDALGALGVPRVLATSAVPINVETVLGRLGLADRFEAIVTAADVRQGKPHPEIYHTAASRAGVQAGRCLVVEDALPGVMAAKAAGAVCLGLMTSEPEGRLRETGADWVAADFTAMPAAIAPDRP
jgi:HAD superfamily hydrolase (TIGR01509 family)